MNEYEKNDFYNYKNEKKYTNSTNEKSLQSDTKAIKSDVNSENLKKYDRNYNTQLRHPSRQLGINPRHASFSRPHSMNMTRSQTKARVLDDVTAGVNSIGVLSTGLFSIFDLSGRSISELKSKFDRLNDKLDNAAKQKEIAKQNEKLSSKQMRMAMSSNLEQALIQQMAMNVEQKLKSKESNNEYNKNTAYEPSEKSSKKVNEVSVADINKRLFSVDEQDLLTDVSELDSSKLRTVDSFEL